MLCSHISQVGSCPPVIACVLGTQLPCMDAVLSLARNTVTICAPLQSLSDQGNLSNLTSFINNAVLFIVAATHVINLTRSAVTGNAGKSTLYLHDVTHLCARGSCMP